MPRRSDEHASRADVSPALASDLRIVLGQLSRRMREQASFSDLTRSQTAALSRLEREGPATKSELARAEGMTPQSMGAIVSALEQEGLVEGAPDERDGRKTILSLTPHAREQFATGRLAREDWLQDAIAAELTDAERVRLADCLDLLRRLSRAS
jgi:Transcriptional regulators